METALPQPMQDSDIAGEMSRLGTSIKNYAQSYYVGGNYPRRESVTQDQLVQLVGDGRPPRAVNLGDGKSSTVGAVRYILAWTILESIESRDSGVRTALLPPDIALGLSVMRQDHDATGTSTITSA